METRQSQKTAAKKFHATCCDQSRTKRGQRKTGEMEKKIQRHNEGGAAKKGVDILQSNGWKGKKKGGRRNGIEAPTTGSG